MNLRLYCACGAAWWLVAEGANALRLAEDWERLHGEGAGHGHAPCGSGEAWRAHMRWALAGNGRLVATDRRDG